MTSFHLQERQWVYGTPEALLLSFLSLRDYNWWLTSLHCDSSKFQLHHMLGMTLLCVVGVYVDHFGWQDRRCLSSGQYERCVTTLEQVRSSASAKGRNSWCWGESIKTGFAVVRETKRGWCLLATPPSSCDFGTITAALNQLKKQNKYIYIF